MTPRVGLEPSLWTAWERTLHRIGDKVVLVEAAEDAAWTAPRLHAAALAWAPRLEPFARGKRIAFRLPNGAAWMAFFLALQRAGLAAIPLDATLPDAAARELARRLGAAALFLGEKCRRLPSARRPAPGVACLKVTSGTTGAPRAVACRAGHLLADGRQVARTMGIGPGDRNLATVPFGHSYGLGNLVLPLIAQGTAVVCAAEFVPRQLVEWIGRHRVTVLPSVPAVFRVLAALPPGAGLKPLRLAISAGAPLAPGTARAFLDRHGVKLHNFYGSSETGGICYDRRGAASLSGRAVGKPLRGVSLSIAGGRIRVAGAAVAAARGCRLLPDRGAWNGRGELVLLGRSGRLANLGGRKVHPDEVERALRSIAGIGDAAVWTAREGGRDLLAAAVETDLALPEVERRLAARLPDWKRPKRYWLAARLPRNARGKLDLPALAALTDPGGRGGK